MNDIELPSDYTDLEKGYIQVILDRSLPIQYRTQFLQFLKYAVREKVRQLAIMFIATELYIERYFGWWEI